MLKLFISEICRRMTDDVAECRALAHTLAVRHVRYEPKESSLVVNAVQEALLHPQVVKLTIFSDKKQSNISVNH